MEHPPPTPTAAPSVRASILIVDDEPGNLLALEAVLDTLGEPLVRASSGEEALRLIEGEPFAVVLLDVRMRGLDGFETAKRIRGRERSRLTPIIFLTAFEDDRFSVREAYQLGAVDYLVKPLIPEILRAKVAVFIELFRKSEVARRQVEELRAWDRRDAERSRMEAALRESEQRFRQLADNLPAGFIYQITVADGATRFSYVSAGVESLLGLTPAEVTAEPLALYGLIDPEDLPRMRSEEENSLGGMRPFDCQFRTRARGGEVRWLHCRSAPRPLPGGGTVWDGIASDITERKLAEEGLKEADRRKDEFLAMLAHELRNPLAPVRNALHLLSLRSDGETVDQVRAMMDRQVGHLARMVDDLLDVSRIARGKVTLNRERLDLAHLARTAAEDHRPAFEAGRVALSVETPQTPVWVSGDATRLGQIMDNLLANALKYTRGGGSVAVRVADAGGEALLTVADTGVGIEPSVLTRLFEPFSQAAQSLDRSEGGLGLGLAIIKGLAELHGGTVAVESAGPGRGSTFTVRLPREREPAALAPAVTPRRAPSGRLRVLVVEDRKDAADSLKMLLEFVGHEVGVAYTGPDGVEAALRLRPDVVVCDIGLPGMDGYAVAGVLRGRAETAGARLIAVTGYGRDEDRRRALEAGFDRHLTKPVDPERLLVEIAKETRA